jgi:hypothetical protein
VKVETLFQWCFAEEKKTATNEERWRVVMGGYFCSGHDGTHTGFGYHFLKIQPHIITKKFEK